MNGSKDDRGDWNLRSKSMHDHDPGVALLRHVVEVWLTTPIVLLGISGNVVAFFVLCQHRRHKLQTTTAILQVNLQAFLGTCHHCTNTCRPLDA